MQLAEHKLISLCVETPNEIVIMITLLREINCYKIRTEYLQDGDKIKETNQEVERNFVYQLFCDLEAAAFEKLDDIKDNSIGTLKVYCGADDYLVKRLSQELLRKESELKKVIVFLLKFVDNSIDKSLFR